MAVEGRDQQELAVRRRVCKSLDVGGWYELIAFNRDEGRRYLQFELDQFDADRSIPTTFDRLPRSFGDYAAPPCS